MVERIRASFDPSRSGDFYVVLKQRVAPIPSPAAGYVAGHGSPWDYDRRVPIIFWRRPQMPQPHEEAVRTIDIMPTLAALLGVPLAPDAVDGQCLPAFSNVACPAR